MDSDGNWTCLRRCELSSSPRVLLTGFEPFHGARLNPSQEILKELSHPNLIATEILPVVFGKASEILIDCIETHRPDYVLALGQAQERNELSLERIAINIDDARIPDNAGNSPIDCAIVSNGPSAYFATLPIKEMVAAIKESGVPAGISNSAGTFLCNHVFYTMQHHLQGTNVKSGFMHLPLLDEQSGDFPGKPTMSRSEMRRGLLAVLDLLAN